MCCEWISVAVVVAFFICWAPFHTQRLISIYSSPDDVQQRAAASKALQAVLFYSSGILYYVSSVINPILYNIMSLKFRRAFTTTLCRGGCRKCCCRETVESRVQATGGRGGARPRRPMAYRFNGDGHVQMLRMDSNDRVYIRRPPGRCGASPASAPAKFSDEAVNIGHARSSAARQFCRGSAANVCDRNTKSLGAEAARRGGQPRADSCPRYLYRADWRPRAVPVVRHSRSPDRPTRFDTAYQQSLAPPSIADRTTVWDGWLTAVKPGFHYGRTELRIRNCSLLYPPSSLAYRAGGENDKLRSSILVFNNNVFVFVGFCVCERVSVCRNALYYLNILKCSLYTVSVRNLPAFALLIVAV